ncbi:MAG TPA: hypothetical protein PK280_15675 [Planctomycetota bacterium]|nr:hypothetical protein [Planctomycetota bacterium]
MIRHRAACPFCSLGCTISLTASAGAGGAGPVRADFDSSNPATGGALCARGNLACELLNLPGRLDTPLVQGRPARWAEALPLLAEAVRRLPSGSLGLVIGPDATPEEAALAGSFAAECLGRAPATIGFHGNEPAVLAEAGAGPAVPEADPAALGAAGAVLAVGDVLALAPVAARGLVAAGGGAPWRGLVSVGRDAGITARVAALKVSGPSERRAALALLAALAAAGRQPPAEAAGVLAALAGADPGVSGPAAEAARALIAARSVAVIAASADPVAVRLARLIAEALAPSASFLALTEAAGARAALAAWRPAEDFAGLVRAVRDNRLRGVLALGCDAVTAAGVYGGAFSKLQLLVAAAPFDNPTVRAAGFALPTRLWAEKSGAAAAPGLAQDYGWILRGLARHLGRELSGRPASPEARPMTAAEAVRAAASADPVPLAAWTAREPSDPLYRSALTGVLVC